MGVLRPSGPLPGRVYWVRRGLVAVAVVLLVALLLWLGGKAFGGSGTPTATPTTSPTTTAVATASSSSPSTPAGTPSATPSRTATASASATVAVKACTDKVVTVVATTDRSSYAADQQPRLTVKVTNTSSVPCTRDVGQKAMELTVRTKAGAAVWSSDDCNPGGSADVRTLRPGASESSTVVWSRTTSKAGCPTGQPKAAAGPYTLVGRNLTVTSTAASFTLV